MQPIVKGQKAKYDGMVFTGEEYARYCRIMERLEVFLTEKHMYDKYYLQ